MTQLEYERAVDLYADDVYRIAYGSTHSREDAKDIVQDVFAKLWQIRNKQDFESGEHLKYWLIRVAINYTNSFWRSFLRRRSVPLDDVGDIGVELEFHDVIEELDLLSPKERQIIHLYYYEDIPLADIAKLIGISEEAARKRLSRARKTLGEKIKENDDGQAEI